MNPSHLTKTDHKWDWKPTHTDALNQLKDALSEDAVNAYFDIDKDTELIVDASPVGLRAMLTQHDKHGRSKVIAYASRALTDICRKSLLTDREGSTSCDLGMSSLPPVHLRTPIHRHN